MDKVYYDFPPYAQELTERLIKTDWFIHSFGLTNKDDIYNPAAYLYNAEFYGNEYVVHLDLNIYQYVLSAFKKEKKKQLHRDAIALMVFGKFTNIMFEPYLAIYEKLNYLEQCPAELVDDLFLFRQIDNAKMDSLAEFALGYTDDIKLPNIEPIDRDTLKSELTKYKRLKKWDNCYLFVLKITELYYFDNGPVLDKIGTFLKWCYSDFQYSIVAISFVVRLMGKKALPKLMKYRPDMSVEKRKNALINMTWDLFLLDKFFENWKQKKDGHEFIYASNDKPLKEVLEIAISIQTNGNAAHLVDFLPATMIGEINKIGDMMARTKGRGIVDVTDFKCYRDELIRINEEIVLG